MLEKALAPLNETLEKLAARLRQEGDNYYKAHTGANPHRPTRLKDAEEAELLVHNKPDWVDVGVTEKYPGFNRRAQNRRV